MNEMETCPFCRGTGTAFAVDAVTPTGVVNPRRAVCMVCDGAGLVAAERVSEPARTDLDALTREVDAHAFGHVPAESLALAITEARRLAAELEALRAERSPSWGAMLNALVEVVARDLTVVEGTPMDPDELGRALVECGKAARKALGLALDGSEDCDEDGDGPPPKLRAALDCATTTRRGGEG